MPGGDGTGPVGRGPLTGWGRGYCADYAGRGFRYGVRGPGRRWGARGAYLGNRWGRAVSTEEDEQQMLKNEVEALEEALNDVRSRLKRLDSNDD